jgi:superfamily I DNA and/or RNA helicase
MCRRPVIVCSATTAGLLAHLDPVRFDHVFLDEAGQALAPEALVPLTLLATPQVG